MTKPRVPLAALALTAILVVFALLLAGNQDRARDRLEDNFADRAAVSSALIDGVFITSTQSSAQDYSSRFGGSAGAPELDAAVREFNWSFAILTEPDGSVIASSAGTPAAAVRDLGPGVPLIEELDQGAPYSLTDLREFPNAAPAFRFSQPVATDQGRRVLITGFSAELLFAFITGVLERVPNEEGGMAYALDSNGAIVGVAGGELAPGETLSRPELLDASQSASRGDFGSDEYFALSPVENSTWRVALTAPQSELFASVRGANRWVPWLLFAALALAGIATLVLMRRALGDARRIGTINRRLESANTALEQRARALARSNDELQQFASIASHDLQEPLRKVQAFTGKVMEEEGDRLTGEGREYLSRASDAASRMQSLIQDLLAYSRVSTHSRPAVSVDTAAIAQEVVSDLDAAVRESGAQIEIGELPPVLADPVHIRQLIQNLIGNALKYRRGEVAPVVSVGGHVHRGEAVITVADNGIGFDQRHHERIFRVFERLHGRNSYPGTGVGLAICRKIAEAHGGTIEAHGRPGEGATFVVRLPAAPVGGAPNGDDPTGERPVTDRKGVRA